MSNELSVINEVRGSLERMQPQFKMALPPNISPERFTRIAVTAIQGNPALLSANRMSLYGACMKCAQDGLLPDGREAALVTFKDTVQYMPMVAGILKKVRNSGDLATIGAHVVYENDTFSYTLGDDERIDHKPLLVGDRGKPVLTYAIAKTKDGGIYREVMTEAQIQSVRNVSRARDNGPWNGPFADEMRRKTAIRRLSKRLPMSTDADELLRHDDEWLGMETTAAPAQTEQAAPEQTAPKPRRKRMQDIVDAETAPVEPDDIIDVEDVL